MIDVQSLWVLPHFFPLEILAVRKGPSQRRLSLSLGFLQADAAAILAARLAAGAITTSSLILLLRHAFSRFRN